MSLGIKREYAFKSVTIEIQSKIFIAKAFYTFTHSKIFHYDCVNINFDILRSIAKIKYLAISSVKAFLVVTI